MKKLLQFKLDSLIPFSKYRIISLFLFTSLIFHVAACNKVAEDNSGGEKWLLLPYPQKILNRGGETALTDDFWVIADLSNPLSSGMANYLVGELSTLSAKKVMITDLYSTRKLRQSVSIDLSTDSTNTEGYSLDLTSSQIKINATTGRGLFYGIQTLLQVLQNNKMVNNGYEIPRAIITDWPQFEVRGILLTTGQIDSLNTDYLINISRLKFNTIFMTEINNLSDSILEFAQERFLDFRSIESMKADDVQIVTPDLSLSIAEVYETTYDINQPQKVVIDLAGVSSNRAMTLLPVYAELWWTAPYYRDIDRLNRWLSRK